MNLKVWPCLTAMCLIVGGCSDRGQPAQEELATMDAAEPVAAKAGDDANGPAPVEAALPRIAYMYRMRFRIPTSAIARVQDTHLALCDRLGAQRCQIVEMQRTSAEESYLGGSLKLRVAADVARRFQSDLTRLSDEAGGRAIDSAIEAEDVSKAMSDTQARIAQRTLLVERLTGVLRSRTGTVAELVEAERSVAQAQEELDQARGWLAELRTRVATSTFEIQYSTAAPASGPLGNKMADTLAQSGSLFTASLQALLLLVVAIVPWLLVIIPGIFLFRRLRRRGVIGMKADREEMSETPPVPKD
ncbi:DUF4349 domain-containing protein [Sphingomonas sp. AX6]|uniref:DUF4349 domain-containing protein n=1 Tax=Sphingomonas sp. AX6 TaxID=2653171 RepID=UPI0012F28BBE|nr:DUF4349 domain-containing protein [Sphingomonas sp. AX6]VXC99239.1 conserved hypothetical protein [Sphingomonas sp. AX6]